MLRRALALTALAGALVGAALPAAAYPGAPWFEPGEPYSENFPDPGVVYDAATSTYYAYATTTGGAYLPVMTSPDARTWTARDAYPQPDCVPSEDDPFFNDALPCPAAWSPDVFGGRLSKEVRAPGAVRIGDRWLVFYAARDATGGHERFCITVASSSSPLGPFTDARPDPIVCDADPNGSLDPAPVVDPATGTPYLVWKSEGVPGSAPTRIWSQPLTPQGTAFAPGSGRTLLLETSQGWEGDVVENPSLVRHAGRWLLFYSGNEWTTASYATGVAFCSGPSGPCHKSPHNPVLRSSGSVLGPGGASGFVDAEGALRLAYHHWRAPYAGYPTDPGCDGIDPETGAPHCVSQGQRRMRIGYVTVAGDRVTITDAPPIVVEARDIDGACPPSLPQHTFDDVERGSTHERAIDCIVHWQVTQGRADGTYGGSGQVTRGQMASFVAAVVDASDQPLPDGAPDAFGDDDGSVHEHNIDRLAAAGIVAGTAAGRFSPSAAVTRAQMATFVARVAEHVTGDGLPAGPDAFADDDASQHEPNIDAAAEAGIATGIVPGTFGPSRSVTRAQMASFLARLLDLLVDEGAATVPAA